MGVLEQRMRSPRRVAGRASDDSLPAVAAWIAAVPTAVVVVLAILVLGPTLGRLVVDGSQPRIWPSLRWAVQPEPTEQARYLIALTAPLLLAGSTAWIATRRVTLLNGVTARRVALAAQAL